MRRKHGRSLSAFITENECAYQSHRPNEASSKSENHKKSTADIKKYTIPLVSLSIITISNHSNTQALGKKLYLVKINASQGQIFKGSGQCTVPSKALGSRP